MGPEGVGQWLRGQRALVSSVSGQSQREAGPEHAWAAILLKLSPGPYRNNELQPDHIATLLWLVLWPCPYFDHYSLLICIYFLLFKHIHIYNHSAEVTAFTILHSILQMRTSGQGV